MTKKRLPPVLLVSGNQGLLRDRRLREIIYGCEKSGWAVEELDSFDEIHNYLSGFASLFSGKRVALWKSKEKFDATMVKEFAKDPSPNLSLLFCYPGTPTAKSDFGKLVKAFPKTHSIFTKPSDFKLEEAAIEFCVAEFKLHGMVISGNLAAALVRKVGSDFGIVSFEVLKATELARAQGVTEIVPEILKGSMAVLAEASIWPLLEALENRNGRATANVLERLGETGRRNTMKVLGTLRATLLTCAQAAELHERGVSPKEAAEIVGSHIYRYQKTILPLARNWGRNRLFVLLEKLAKAERAVLSGGIDPWNTLVSGILSTV
jgi:DNA polymerase III delta subunit